MDEQVAACRKEGVAVVLVHVVAVAASERGGGEGGASAVEAGQSCSRHQGRHFLWGERDRERER